jgi:hypothetical protein
MEENRGGRWKQNVEFKPSQNSLNRPVYIVQMSTFRQQRKTNRAAWIHDDPRPWVIVFQSGDQ